MGNHELNLSDDWEEQARVLLEGMSPRRSRVVVLSAVAAVLVLCSPVLLTWSVWLAFAAVVASWVVLYRLSWMVSSAMLPSRVQSWVRDLRREYGGPVTPPWNRHR